MTRRRFRFKGRGHTLQGSAYYIWEAPVPGDSRVERVTCLVSYFWMPLGYSLGTTPPFYTETR